MVIPVYDDASPFPALRPWVMWSILAVNVLAASYVSVLSDAALPLLIKLSVIPVVLTDPVASAQFDPLIPPVLTLGTYMFLHGSWLHLAGNMIFLWVFGDDLESAMGHLRFLLFYLACGVAGAAAHVWSEPASASPLIGASGAVAGIVAGYVVLRPWAHVTVLLFGIMTFQVHAFWLLGAWIVWQIVNVLFASESMVSYWAHLGGLIAGTALVFVLRRPGVPVFQRHAGPPPPRR